MKTLTVLLAAALLHGGSVTITEPVDGWTYEGDWLTVRAVVTNDNLTPDSVLYSLNGSAETVVPRLCTDWPTYMAGNCRRGFSQSPPPEDDTILWTASITGDTHEFCGPVVVDGMVYYVSDQQSTAYGLSAVTGDVIWQYDVVDHVDDAVSWYDGRVYIAADSAWCLDAVTGQRIWSYKGTPGVKMNGTPVLEDGVAYFTYAPTWSSLQVCALDALTGDEIWVTDIPFYSTGCASLWQDMLFVPTYQGCLYALDTATGSIIWENSDAYQGYWDSSPVIVDGMIYIGGFDGKMRCMDALEGSTVWETEITGGQHYIAATPAYSDQRLFFADQISTYHCLSALDGTPLWTTTGVQHGSSGIAQNTVFYGQGADNLDFGGVVALDCGTGQELWSYQTGNTDIFSSPAITDGILYIAGMDWNLYAFGTELEFSYLDDLYALVGSNCLVVTSYYDGLPAAADTVNFTVTGTGLSAGTESSILLSAGPNPFSSSTSISFGLPEAGETVMTIYDVAGRAVRVLEGSMMDRGGHTLVWDGTDDCGRYLSSGIYFLTIRSGVFHGSLGLCLVR